MSDTDQALHALLRLQKRLIGRGSGASCCTDVKIVKIREDFQKIKDTLAKLVAERDEARRDAERWEDDALRLLNERNAAERERDEAQRECCVRTVDAGGNPAHAPLEEAIAEAKRRGWKCYRTAEDA